MKKPTPVFSLTSAPPCAALVLALALATSACQPGGVATSTTPAPQSTVYHCGNINETCSKEDFDKFEEKRKLAEQAEQVYREIQAERRRLENAGGAEDPTSLLTERAGDTYLTMVMGLLRDQKAKGLTVDGEVVIRSVKMEPAREGAVLTLRSCEDGSGSRTLDASGKVVGTGGLVDAITDFRIVDGKLKAVKGSGKVVPSCD